MNVVLLAGVMTLYGMQGDPVDLISPAERKEIIDHERTWQPELPARTPYVGTPRLKGEPFDELTTIRINKNRSVRTVFDSIARLKSGYTIEYGEGVSLLRPVGSIEIINLTWEEMLASIAVSTALDIFDDKERLVLVVEKPDE